MDQNHLAIDKLGNPDLILDDEDKEMLDSEPEIAASHSSSNVPIPISDVEAEDKLARSQIKEKVGKNSKIKSITRLLV